MLPLKGAQVRSLVGKQRSCMLLSVVKKKRILKYCRMVFCQVGSRTGEGGESSRCSSG